MKVLVAFPYTMYKSTIEKVAHIIGADYAMRLNSNKLIENYLVVNFDTAVGFFEFINLVQDTLDSGVILAISKRQDSDLLVSYNDCDWMLEIDLGEAK